MRGVSWLTAAVPPLGRVLPTLNGAPMISAGQLGALRWGAARAKWEDLRMSLIRGTDGAIAAASAHVYANVVINTGPVAWWPLDANLVDRIGGRNGTIGAGSEVHGAALPADSGGGFDCAGTSWISVAHAAALKPAVGSLMAWFKPAAVHNGIVMAVNAAGTSNPADFALRVNSSGTVSCFFQQGGATQLIQTSSAYYVAGQIIHAIVTFDTNGFTLYLDGNKIASNTVHTVGFTDNTLDWRFGNELQASGDIFNGVIDEIAIWDRVLTRNEIYLLAQTEPD
jgi:Concanavalin A-like lectin/glucanases superfamily